MQLVCDRRVLSANPKLKVTGTGRNAGWRRGGEMFHFEMVDQGSDNWLASQSCIYPSRSFADSSLDGVKRAVMQPVIRVMAQTAPVHPFTKHCSMGWSMGSITWHRLPFIFLSVSNETWVRLLPYTVL